MSSRSPDAAIGSPTVNSGSRRADMVTEHRIVRFLERWASRTRWLLLGASIVFLVAWTIVVVDESLAPATALVLNIVLGAIWLAFAIDYVLRLMLSRDRGHFIRRNLADLLSVLVPAFRPFLLLRYLSQVPYFRGEGGNAFRSRVIAFAVIVAAMFIYVISVAVLHAERGAEGANITNLGDAIWWACVTIATVGYGDLYPVTWTGRTLSIVLMIGGIAIVGTASATVISYFNDRTGRLRQQRRDG
jgi:voltage-gated potassium channel